MRENEMDIVIRLATSSDAPNMAEVHMRSWEAAYKDIIPIDYIRERNAGRPALWDRILEKENTTQYIIEKDDKTAGMLGIDVSRDNDVDDCTYELTGLYLLPEYFYQGIGTQTMEFAFIKARSLKMKVMTVWLLENNHNAKRFYEKCGFIPDGSTREENFGKILNSIRMRINL
jgi:GNAT superfamily N-acetyltransferase